MQLSGDVEADEELARERIDTEPALLETVPYVEGQEEGVAAAEGSEEGVEEGREEEEGVRVVEDDDGDMCLNTGVGEAVGEECPERQCNTERTVGEEGKTIGADRGDEEGVWSLVDSVGGIFGSPSPGP